jgi:hypothetical protein
MTLALCKTLDQFVEWLYYSKRILPMELKLEGNDWKLEMLVTKDGETKILKDVSASSASIKDGFQVSVVDCELEEHNFVVTDGVLQ